MADTGIETELLRLEDERCKAVLAKDIATLERLIANDIIYTHSSGRLDTKASFIESIRSGTTQYRRIERRSLATLVRNGFACLTGAIEIDVETGGGVLNLNLRFSNVWERTASGWQQILWQSTPIPR